MKQHYGVLEPAGTSVSGFKGVVHVSGVDLETAAAERSRLAAEGRRVRVVRLVQVPRTGRNPYPLPLTSGDLVRLREIERGEAAA